MHRARFPYCMLFFDGSVYNANAVDGNNVLFIRGMVRTVVRIRGYVCVVRLKTFENLWRYFRADQKIYNMFFVLNSGERGLFRKR